VGGAARALSPFDCLCCLSALLEECEFVSRARDWAMAQERGGDWSIIGSAGLDS
jgi:hypothetical protein